MSGRSMISIDTAGRITSILLKHSAELDALVADLQATVPKSECDQARLIIGKIMGEFYLQALQPLFADHPELKPSWL